MPPFPVDTTTTKRCKIILSVVRLSSLGRGLGQGIPLINYKVELLAPAQLLEPCVIRTSIHQSHQPIMFSTNRPKWDEKIEM